MRIVEEEEEEAEEEEGGVQTQAGSEDGIPWESMPKALAVLRDAPPAIGTPFPHLTGQHHPRLCSWGELETTAPNYCYHRHGSCGDYDCASVSHSA